MAGEQIRLLVVEDVPQVASHIRSLLQAQSQIKMLDVVTAGDRAVASVAEIRPDVVIVDALLQGRVSLIDGSLQFSDLRGLLRVPAVAPSIVNLPTDRIREQDLAEVTWRDPSGIDILLAPPRIEMAEMVTTRDIEKVLSLLRQLYEFVIIDTRAALSEDVLVFLDSADLILQVLTYDSMAIRALAMSAETFVQIGYPPSKLATVLNRADASGGFDKADVEQALGSKIDFEVVSDGRLVLSSNNEGIAFVASNPEPPIAQGVLRIAESLTSHLKGRTPALVGR